MRCALALLCTLILVGWTATATLTPSPLASPLAATATIGPTGTAVRVLPTAVPLAATIAVPTATLAPPHTAPRATTTLVSHFGQPSKTSGRLVAGGLPDGACTPGAIIATASTAMICTPGYAKSVRNVTVTEKNAVYTKYGIMSHRAGEYEVNDLSRLKLGGSNDIANLWPERSEPRPGFHENDRVENEFRARVCAGTLALADAQREFATNWLALS